MLETSAFGPVAESTGHDSANPGSTTQSQSAYPPPAWEGVALTKANLVLEGGAMRGQFTAGVLDFLMDQKIFCEYVVGVSAGALTAYNYVAGLPGRSCLINVKYCTDMRYLSLQSFVRTGNAYGRDFAFHAIPDVLDPFDKSLIARSPIRFEVVSSDLDTGEADYHRFCDHRADLPYLIASSSMPGVSKIVEVDGKHLLDGGTCDSVPLTHSMLTGAKKHIVVLTRQLGYVKKPNKLMALMRQLYGDYPYFLERLQNRHYEYNRCYRRLVREAEAGNIFLIRPEVPITVSNIEHDPEKLLNLYQQGLDVAAKRWPALQEYLAK